MPTETMQGVFPILVTPFDDKGRIDEESLRALVEFNLDAGVHGLGVAIGSEMFKFNEAERAEVTRIVIDQVRKRVPVVINTGAGGTDLAVFYSRTAEDAGADALMIIPPAFLPAGPDEVVDYYRAISDAVSIPIFLQDIPAAPIPPGLARRIAETAENVRYIKVETLPVTAKVAEMVNAAGRCAHRLRRRRRQLLHRGAAPRLARHHAVLQPAGGLRRGLEPLPRRRRDAAPAPPSTGRSCRSTGSRRRAATSSTTSTSSSSSARA